MLALLYALEEEVAGIHNLMDQREAVPHPWAMIERGVFDGMEMLLVKSGAGKVLSSMTAQSVIATFQPTTMLLCGISGALNPSYERGDLVIGHEFIQHDITTDFLGFEPGQVPFTEYRMIPAEKRLLEHARSFSLDDAQVHCGRIASGDQFISGQQGAAIRAQFAADVVDMESAAVSFVCHLNQVPLVVARTISDRADESAAIDFGEFLPRASRHVTAFVRHMVARPASGI